MCGSPLYLPRLRDKVVHSRISRQRAGSNRLREMRWSAHEVQGGGSCRVRLGDAGTRAGLATRRHPPPFPCARLQTAGAELPMSGQQPPGLPAFSAEGPNMSGTSPGAGRHDADTAGNGHNLEVSAQSPVTYEIVRAGTGWPEPRQQADTESRSAPAGEPDSDTRTRGAGEGPPRSIRSFFLYVGLTDF